MGPLSGRSPDRHLSADPDPAARFLTMATDDPDGPVGTVVMDEVYRRLARTYADFSADNPVNALYDRPNVLRLAGDLRGRRVLELGCAGGLLTERLVDAGADVLAVDREPRMVALAAERLAGRAEVAVADLEEPLDGVATGSVDVVVASLVLHYVADWGPLLAELHRVLAPGGALVFSIHHPITGWNLSDGSHYHRTETIHEAWTWSGRAVTATLWRRPVSAVFTALRSAGFSVDAVEEPLMSDLPLDMDARVRAVLLSSPVFLFVRGLREETARGGAAAT